MSGGLITQRQVSIIHVTSILQLPLQVIGAGAGTDRWIDSPFKMWGNNLPALQAKLCAKLFSNIQLFFSFLN